jgi:18S rRNA (guanine1575-N7)-methyltransferase
MIEI